MNRDSSIQPLPLSRLLAASGGCGIATAVVGSLLIGAAASGSRVGVTALLAGATVAIVVLSTSWFVALGSRMQATLGIVVVAGSIVRGVALLAAGAVVHYALGPNPLAYWLGLVVGWVGIKIGELWVVAPALSGVRHSGTERVA